MLHTRILVADDEPEMGIHIRRCLEQFCFEVPAIVFTGAEALQAACELHPDLVLMDIGMPGDMDGADAAVKIRFDLNVPVIFITGSHDDATMERAIKAEPIGYLLKPFDPDTLRTTINSSLHQYRAACAREEGLIHDAAEQLGAIFENSTFGICRTSPSGKLLNANNALANILGYGSATELLARTTYVQKEVYENPEDRRRLIQQLTHEGAAHNFETRAHRRDGSLIWISIHAHLIRDAEGKNLYCESIIQDIDRQKGIQLERDQMEVMLRQAQKLESIGQLAAGIAHEINTPTQYVGDNLRFFKEAFGNIERALGAYGQLFEGCKKGPAPDDLLDQVAADIQSADLDYLRGEIPQAITQTQDGIDRIATIVRAMKEFSHPGAKDRIDTDIHKAINSTLIVCRNEYKYVADLTTNLDPALPLVPCYPGDFNHVIMNLVVNAAHAIADSLKGSTNKKGIIAVTTRREGDWAEIRISDSGTGIPEAIRSRIFDPFFTTKDVGKGTGQGLAICHAVIVKKHGGTITFDTEMGTGTTFVVRLPLTSGERQGEAA